MEAKGLECQHYKEYQPHQVTPQIQLHMLNEKFENILNPQSGEQTPSLNPSLSYCCYNELSIQKLSIPWMNPFIHISVTPNKHCIPSHNDFPHVDT